MKSSINTSSVDKAFILLEFLAANGAPASLQQVTEAVKLPKPTAYRLLRMLQELGYVSRPADSRDYLVGPRVARLAAQDPWAEVKAHARPLLRKLHEEFNETVNLGILSGRRTMYLDYIDTTQSLRYIVTPGQSDPWYCTALGRAAAAQLNDKALERLINDTRFQLVTPETIVDSKNLMASVLDTRKQGYAEEKEESVQGVSCLAVSLTPLGFSEAAVSIAVPMLRLSAKRRTDILHAMKNLLR